MALNRKLTDKPEKITLPSNAWLHLIDIDDVTDSPQGSDFKMKLSVFFNSIVSALTSLFVPYSREITINGDTKDLSVNRSWTITAQPITGSVEIEENDKAFFTKASNYPDDYNSIGFAQSGVYLNYKNDITLESSRLSVGGENFIEVFSNKPNFQGINGYHDYSANYTANSYVQKDWVENLLGGGTKNRVEWYNTNASGGIWIGTAGLGAGTFAAVWPSDTNLYTSLKKSQYSNVLTTANQALGQRNNETIFFRGSSVLGAGGFKFSSRGGMTTWTNGGRFFAGMATASTVVSANPSLLANTVGFATDDTDAGLISFITRSATTLTKVSTGFTWVSNEGYDFEIFCAPNGSEYTWKITSLQTGATVTGTANTNLPVNNTKQLACFLASNAALTPVNSIQLGLNRITIETNY